MKFKKISQSRRQNKQRNFLRLFILLLTGAAVFGALILPISSRPTAYKITTGSVASYDILAPRNLTYPSDILTKARDEQIRSSVQPIYLPIDTTIARHQIDRLRKSLNFISIIRNDPYAVSNIKIDDLSKLNDINLDKETAMSVINLDENNWVSVQQEAITVLEQSLRNTIRDYQIEEYRRKIPSLISYSFDQETSLIIEELTAPYITANSLFSEEQTQESIESALKDLHPVEKTFYTGEIIVRRGAIIDDVTFEALDKYNLINAKEENNVFASATIFSLVITSLAGFYFYKRDNLVNKKIRDLLVIAILFVVFIFAAKFLIPNRTVLPFIFPIAGLTLAIGSLFGFELAFVITIMVAATIAYDMPNSGELVLFYVIPGIFGTLILGQGRRISVFFLAGLTVGVIGSGVIVASRVLENQTDLIGVLTLILASLLNGMASASLGLLIQFIISQFLGITTAIQLLEISRPDHPLLQFILKNAPGTYQHSLQVSNLAEQAAKDIGADQLLTRVGAIYHDAGKALHPTFFIENQVNGIKNPHDSLDPYTSASTVIKHVTDGVELAKKYRLPSVIHNFMLEHHGTLMTRYFYVKAVEAKDNDPEKVNQEDFQYPGPPPQSKETALLMLADVCEARARAEKPQTKEDLYNMVQKVIQFCQKEDQLKNTDLTLQDLTTIADSFTDTLINTYHPRIIYPELKPQKETNHA